jgi:hypothetical protein
MNLNSTYPNQTVIITDIVQALAADLSVVNSVISYGNPLATVCAYEDIRVRTARITAPVAEVLQVTTLTPVNAANSTYTFIIQQYNQTLGSYQTFEYTHTTAASGSSATTISAAFIAAVNADPTVHVTASGAATIILTADAGYAIFIVSITATGGGLTQVTGTAGVRAVGTLASLALQGITVTGSTYTQVHFEYNQPTGFNNKDQVSLRSTFDLYINQAATNRAALVTAWTELLGNLELGAVTPSIEGMARL